MANQIKTKFIGNDQVTSEKILLENNSGIRAKDSGGATQEIIKIDSTDKVVVYRSTGAEELAYMSDVNSGGTALQNHIDDAADAHDASAISFVPAGNIEATEVQAAIQELDNEKVAKSGDTMSGPLIVQNLASANPLMTTVEGASVNTQEEDLTNDKLNYSAYGAAFLEISSETLNNPVYAKHFTMMYDQGKLSLIEGASDPMVPTLPEHAATKKYVDDSVAGVAGDYVNTSGDTMTGNLNMGQNEVQNASKLQVKDGSNNEIFKAEVSSFDYRDSSDPSKSLIYAGSGTSIISGFDNTSQSLASVISGFNGSNIGVLSSAAKSGSGFAQQVTLVDPASNDLFSSNEVYSPTTVAYGAAMFAAASNTTKFEIGIQDNSGLGEYRFTSTNFDMDGKKIVDVQQLENLSAGTVSGNTLRWDELGAYSISAGYGIATLDSGGKIPAEQLPNAIMEYKGTWDASTNTPMLANGSPANAPEDAGHLYIVSVGGTVNFGAGNISFNAGDSVILSASLIWEKSTTANLVTSVNGAQGVVVLDAEDLVYHQANASDWTVADDSSIKLTLDEVGSRLTSNEGDIAAVTDDVSHLVTLSGVAVDSNSLGSFTGSTIPDSQTVKQALQALETAHEDHVNDSSDAHMASAIGLSLPVNSQTTVQGSLEDHETRIDAMEAKQWATPYKKTLIAGDISNGYIDLPHLAIDTNSMDAFVDRLAIHQGASEDYTVSVVGGATRITFLNDLVNPGSQKLAVGDSIYVRYMKNA